MASRFLLARYGPLTAVRHLYSLSHHSQLSHRASAQEQDEIISEILRELCEAGAELALHDALLLMQAARAGHISVVSELIRVAKPSTFALSRALTAASETGRREVVRALLAAGAPAAAYQSAALSAAVAHGDPEVVYVLCATGADPAADHSRALRRAVQLGHIEAARTLLQYGADVRVMCSAVLLHACQLPVFVSTAARAATEPRVPGCGGGALLYPSAAAAAAASPCCAGGSDGDSDSQKTCNDVERQSLELVQLLLRAGADVRWHGRPALEAAASRGYRTLVGVLLAAGADPAACNSSALVAASIQGHVDVVDMLLESGADPWDVTDFAIRTASERGHASVLRTLRLAQLATTSSSVPTGEDFSGLQGSSGGGLGDGSHTPPTLVAPACRWSVSPPFASAAGGRWSACLPVVATPSTGAAGAVLGTTEGETLGAVLRRTCMYESPPCGFDR
ncbi:hypothetical protein VOLCADRAFT_87656 [Volvox carteri f. nagariensis]|uniref:Uncharacterized protein n=1 Tax=Volvox carteri f. nagariensis TaxID=3068 RepID=D8TLW7_VOLCA|nr:uncharacterized protein VOLCADRAFT_87656 [Volvox carteri f. nagariensis]EFJ51405.1 hypothetical protein VOLCADRAFT_87656 [Volvox carteri f. nagariensis]|eukprot:XP_002947357.1 hypothetical protein VOLCADRAFT_87656 [Volvox carteri f. nagariensis]